MKAICIYLFGTIVVLVFTIKFSNAQTANLKPAPADVAIDGNAEEWGDKLPYTNDKARVSYAISNDKTNLYVVVKTKDAGAQRNILASGITFGINTKSKKSITYSVTFPARVAKDNPFDYLHLDPGQTMAKIVEAKYRKLNPKGFKEIKEEELSPINAYNIQVAMGYDDEGCLVYEEAVPLKLFNAEGSPDKEWAFNIKINGVETTGYPKVTPPVGERSSASTINNRQGVVAFDRSQPLTSIQLTPSVDFWDKFVLAK